MMRKRFSGAALPSLGCQFHSLLSWGAIWLMEKRESRSVEGGELKPALLLLGGIKSSLQKRGVAGRPSENGLPIISSGRGLGPGRG
ncbi:hypothetical protein AAHA92_00631 [Salvia divinorum]|uniref:Uncharacterized protein n=1 Tax=Salvia divinorum TaxID=28513 RepID=A0ABD1ILA3_SALDI